MKNLILLYKLRWKLLVHEFRNKGSKSSLFIPVFILFFSLVFGGLIGFVIRNYIPETKTINWTHLASGYLLLIFLTSVFRKIISPQRYIGTLDKRVISYYPVSIFKVFFADLTFGLVDLLYLFMLCMVAGIFVGFWWASLTIISLISFILFLFYLVFLIHLSSEIISNSIKLLNYFPRVLIFCGVCVGITVLYIYLSGIVSASNWIGSFFNEAAAFIDIYFFHNFAHQQASFFIAHLVLITALTSLFFVQKYIDIYMLKKYSFGNGTFKRTIKIRDINWKNIFRTKHYYLFQKDIKYFFRNRRILTSMLIELFIYVYIFYSKLGTKDFQNILVVLFVCLSVPIAVWDSYLSNQWGTDKNGFALYLLGGVNAKMLILSKNITFLVVRIFYTIILCGFLGFYFSIRIIPFIILLQYSIIQLNMIFANNNSIINPYPVDLKENAFSNIRTAPFKLIGFLGLLVAFFVPLILLVILYIYELQLITFVIYLATFIVIMLVYIKSLDLTAKKFDTNKEIMLNKLMEQ